MNGAPDSGHGPRPGARDPDAAAWTIRPAEPRDAAAIWDLVGGLARFERLERSGSAEALAAHLFGGAWPEIECRVADAGGTLVGYALFYPTFSSFATLPSLWLEDLYVAEPQRGTGLGAALLAAVARRSRERGCGRLEWIVLDWNRDAIGFYERQGAQPHGGWLIYGVAGKALDDLGSR
jgi:GNAT superfamily N-acetyltransferase